MHQAVFSHLKKKKKKKKSRKTFYFMIWLIITLRTEWKLQRLCHWFDMILAQQFPQFHLLWAIRSLLADLYALLLHGRQNMRIREICILNLPLTSSVLAETNFSSFSIFFHNSHNKKWKYYITNRLSYHSRFF